MKSEFLKLLNENIPYILKRPFSKFIRARLINNQYFVKQYEKLIQFEANENLDNEIISELKRVLIHAYEETEYYHRIFDDCCFDPYSIKNIEEISKLPILTREMLVDNIEEIGAKDVSDFYVVSTSGTSGDAANIWMAGNAIYKEWAFVYHYWSKFGYDYKSSRLATFRGVDLGNSIYEINPLYAEIRMNPFLMNNKNIKHYIKLIDRYKADFIYGYPSSVFNFCRLAKNAKIDLKGRFRAVFLISENLYPFQEEMISNVLNSPIAIFYGHSERATFAEKYSNGYVFNPLYGITEINLNGEPIVTGFINDKMPLIRYLVDDKVESITFNKEKAELKRLEPKNTTFFASKNVVFSIIGHRDSEVIYGNNGEYFAGGRLNFHGLLSENFSGIQLAQKKPGELIICYLKDDNISEKDLNRVIEICKNRLGDDFKFKTEQVEKLKLSPRGKYKLLIQYISSEEQEKILH